MNMNIFTNLKPKSSKEIHAEIISPYTESMWTKFPFPAHVNAVGSLTSLVDAIKYLMLVLF